MFSIGEFPSIAPAPMIMIPVPKKNEDAIEIPKNFLKITFKNTYKLAQPRLIIIFPSIAQINDHALTAKLMPENSPARIVAKRYEMHMQAIENAPMIVFEIM